MRVYMKNFVSFISYGIKNKRIRIVSLLIDLFLLVYGSVESYYLLTENPSIIILVVTVFGNIIWQGVSFKDLFKFCRVDYPNESSKVEVDYSRFVSKDESICRIGNNHIAFNLKECKKLQKYNPEIQVDKQASKKVDNYILNYFDILLPFLSKHYQESKNKVFVNDAKLCLPGNISFTTPIRVSKGSYYNTYLTNKIFSRSLITNDSPNIYPPLSILNNELCLPCEFFSNEIGVSTIAITSDGFMFFQVQGTHSDSSPGLIVPSGSGSADWNDYKRSSHNHLKEIIDYATVRELLEETGLKSKLQKNVIASNKVIGFFRWLDYGGKPEFVSITKLNCRITDIKPQSSEQKAYLSDNYIFCIFNKNKDVNEDELNKAFKVMESEQCSTPLYASLLFIKELYYKNKKNLCCLL